MLKKKKPGFTLMEMIIVVALTVVVLGITSSIFITGNRVFSDSDVRSTLQMEGQAIQENISDIGMQGTEVISVIPNVQVGDVQSLIIKSYVEEDDNPRYFRIQRNGRILSISRCTDADCNVIETTRNISENLESLRIDYNDEAKSIKFDIELSETNGFSDVTYPINFTSTFRNKGN